MIYRLLNLLKTNSFFLFGARGTGKTRLVNDLIPAKDSIYIDLLDPAQYEQFLVDPSRLSRLIEARGKNIEWIVIDEVQKVLPLLDIAHASIEKYGLKFALTGSSARKLKRGGANLLAGRAFTYHLYPFTSEELGLGFDLERCLAWGTLPKPYTADTNEERELFLRSYVHTYLKEEIQVEQIVRRLDPFRKFLSVAAQMNGALLNFSNIARDIGSTTPTVQSYFQILEDTLLGFYLEPYHLSIRKRQKEAPKFYFFDTGVQRALAEVLTLPLVESSYGYGKTFEHFIILELHRRSSYLRNDFKFSFLVTKDDAEIDLIVERPGRKTILIEIKSTTTVREDHVSALRKFLPDFKNSEGICLSRDRTVQKFGDVTCLPWDVGILKILAD